MPWISFWSFFILFSLFCFEYIILVCFKAVTKKRNEKFQILNHHRCCKELSFCVSIFFNIVFCFLFVNVIVVVVAVLVALVVINVIDYRNKQKKSYFSMKILHIWIMMIFLHSKCEFAFALFCFRLIHHCLFFLFFVVERIERIGHSFFFGGKNLMEKSREKKIPELFENLKCRNFFLTLPSLSLSLSIL